jgi:peptidyl-tRNA hydrolase
MKKPSHLISDSDYRLYILMRNDLPSMNPGRAMAQASHASNALVKEFGRWTEVRRWQNQTTQGFGTTIVLSADISAIEDIWSKIRYDFLIKDKVIDPDYVIPIPLEVMPCIDKRYRNNFVLSDDKRKYFFSRKEVTCAYVLGMTEKLSPILKDLPLHP